MIALSAVGVEQIGAGEVGVTAGDTIEVAIGDDVGEGHRIREIPVQLRRQALVTGVVKRIGIERVAVEGSGASERHPAIGFDRIDRNRTRALVACAHSRVAVIVDVSDIIDEADACIRAQFPERLRAQEELICVLVVCARVAIFDEAFA